MRGLGPDGELTPEMDAALQRLVGEIADEGDLVVSYLVVAVVQGLDDDEPSTLVAPMPRQSDPMTLGLAHFAAMRVGLVSGRRDEG